MYLSPPDKYIYGLPKPDTEIHPHKVGVCLKKGFKIEGKYATARFANASIFEGRGSTK